MTLWIGIAVTLVVLSAAMMAFIGTRSETFRVERSAEIHAPREAVFPLINDLHQWARWSPWERKDPDMERTFEGPSAGPGAVYAWSGDRNVGSGRMTILESKPAELITLRLEFFKPFAGTNQTVFKFEPYGDGTLVTWSMEGPNTTMSKAISLILNMDRMIGKDFEAGLANLNAAARDAS